MFVKIPDASLYKFATAKASAMLFALSEPIKFSSREPSLRDEDFNVGLEEIIADLAKEFESKL